MLSEDTREESLCMYKVFRVIGGYQIFWCPSAPIHYDDRKPYDGRVYPKRQAAYRRCQQLSQREGERTDASVPLGVLPA
jgi:hypothetical protein